MFENSENTTANEQFVSDMSGINVNTAEHEQFVWYKGLKCQVLAVIRPLGSYRCYHIVDEDRNLYVVPLHEVSISNEWMNET